ncbi:GntT/GntP/DsdX family permease [Nisaea sediminum]|uniref:GntT/GntP/DsdX family permease n=1 Tax=Nisaea sediminum TaxID=2775867 RepID=UPI001866A0DC|nr:permease [Nisaea sediminum]
MGHVQSAASGIRRGAPDLPLPVWMALVTIALGLASGMSTPELIANFNTGFGLALGEFALILLPSFTLAAAMEEHALTLDGRLAVMAAPVAGAGMVCPDTAFASLAPIAGRRKLDVAFGAYTGFKLLYPAGPLIVATGLGVESDAIILAGMLLALPVWLTGLVWRRFLDRDIPGSPPETRPAARAAALRPMLPFGLLAILLILGALPGLSALPLAGFLCHPKGALLAAAILALVLLEPSNRRACLDRAVRRTGALLLLIGCASAFGTVLTHVLPFTAFLPGTTGAVGLFGLFLLSAAFKLMQGSSMATFAAIAPVAAPAVVELGLPGVAAVFAICLGSFIAILPNDSFYWIVRTTCFAEGRDRSIAILTAGSVLQAAVGFLCLLALTWSGLI